jgi:hypothetical protein
MLRIETKIDDRKLRKLPARVRRAVEAAQAEAAEALKLEAQARTPVRTGALRDSAHVNVNPGKLEASVDYSGVDYATIVHEDPYLDHPTGEDHFLERPAKEMEHVYPRYIGRAIRRAIHR